MPNALLYDFLLVNGGAEHMALMTANALNNLELCVAFVNHNQFSPDDLPLSLHSLMKPVFQPGWQSIRVLRAFKEKTKFLSQYKTVIYSGIYAPVAIVNHQDGHNILYCHTPPRFVYDLKDYYLSQASMWQRPLLKRLIDYVQPRYETAFNQMDVVIANSENVRRRIRQFLRRDALIIHPPVAIEKYCWLGQGDYYLSTSRLEPYKRVDLIIKAFKRMPDKKLIVVSGGTEFSKLEKLAVASTNINFVGWVAQPKLIELIGNSIASIYIPRNEDFGMSPVESMAAGKPVVGVSEGGLTETVVQGKTGLLVPSKPEVEDIIHAVRELTPLKALEMRVACEERAQYFRPELYIKKIQDLIG